MHSHKQDTLHQLVEQFLLLLFGTTNEAIELGYVVPELRSLYTEKYTDEVYDSLAYFAGKQHDMFKGVDVGHFISLL